MKKILLFLTICGIANSTLAQKKTFNTDDLLNNKLPNYFFQTTPMVKDWLGNNKVLVYAKKSPNETALSNQILDLKTGKFSEPKSAELVKSETLGKYLVSKNGDLFLVNGKNEMQLTHDADLEEKNAMLSPDSNYVAYSKSNNLYTFDLKTNKENKLTSDGTKTTLNGFATWLYYEEIYGRPTQYRAFWWSPDSKTIAYAHFDESKINMFPIYNSEGQHGFIEETRYPQSGDSNPIVKYGFVNADGGNTIWADFEETGDQYLGWPKWTADGSGLMVQWINRGNDNLKIYNVSPKTGAKKQIYEETQKSWISIDEADDRLTLLDGGKEMIIISDKTGWKQLYLYATDGTLKNPITEGKFTVTEVMGIDQKNRVLYFHARGIENSARFDLYKVGLDGKNQQRLTFGEFNHKKIMLSPDFKYFVTMYSNMKTPQTVAIVDNNGKIIKELGNGQGAEMNNYAMALPELVRVKSDDGLFDLPMSIVYPLNMEAGKKYPVLVSIYGGPDAGTVYDQWQWSAKSQLYAQEGIIQVALDHRASGHFGKEGVAYMHRNLGHWELIDYKTMIKYLVDKGVADPSKICITGFSYGGYMTCLALTKAADVFTHGMAGGSVTDWKLYDSAYTERFMDTPTENPEGYKNGSVLTYADKLKGKLLLVHGTMDDNVHMQNSIQLIHKLEDNKKDFELMLYPGGRHGWGGIKSTHFDLLKTKFVYNNLLNKPLPTGLFNN